MQFLYTFLFAATVLATNTVHFINQDSTERTIYFTAQSGLAEIESLVVPGLQTANQTFPEEWIGNFFSVSQGAEYTPGMLGELRWNGFGGANYFDVSAIVNPNDVNGVKMIFPMNSNNPVSGCQTFPCANAYNKWDDIATQATQDSDLVCLLGNLSNERRRGLGARMGGEFISS